MNTPTTAAPPETVAPPTNPDWSPAGPLPVFEFDREQNTFSCTVVAYRRIKGPTADNKFVLGADKQPVIDRTLGAFTFKVPTMDEYVDIGVRRASKTHGAPVDNVTAYYAEALTALPFVSVTIPEGWKWETLRYPKDMETVLALYEAYSAGLDRF